jgi:plastocyanin
MFNYLLLIYYFGSIFRINITTGTTGPIELNINEDLAGAQDTTINFVADKEGIFTYYCVYHLPTMTGKLVILP